MLWEGFPPTVVLSSAKGSNDQRGYHPGEKIGEWKIISVDNQFIELEWDGKRFKKRLDELMDRTPVLMAEAPAQQAAPAAAAPVTKSLSETKNGQGRGHGRRHQGLCGRRQAGDRLGCERIEKDCEPNPIWIGLPLGTYELRN